MNLACLFQRITYMVSCSFLLVGSTAIASTTWDKTFPKSDTVEHQKVTFQNRYGITLVEHGYTYQKIVPIKLHQPLLSVVLMAR